MFLALALSICAASITELAHGEDPPDRVPVSVGGTPITVWAKPLQDGPIRALLVVPGQGIVDADRLKNGLDLDAQVLRFQSESVNMVSSQLLNTLTEKSGKRPEVVVLGRYPMDSIDRELKTALLNFVNDGGGVVVVGYGSQSSEWLGEVFQETGIVEVKEQFTHSIGASFLNGWRPNLDRVRAYEVGEGRAAEISYWSDDDAFQSLMTGEAGEAINAPTTSANYVSLVAQVVRWAARGNAKIRIDRVDANSASRLMDIDTPPQLPREYIQRMRDSAPPAATQPYELKFSAPLDRRYEVRVQARYPFRNRQWNFVAEQIAQKNSESIVVNVPGGSGDYFLDFWLLDRGRVVDWHTKAIHIDAWPEISNVSFSTLAIDENDRISVKLDVRKNFREPRVSLVVVRATDANGRTVAMKEQKIGREGGPAEVQLSLVDLLSPYLKLEVFAVDQLKGPLTNWGMDHGAYAFAHVLVRRTQRDEFLFASDLKTESGFNSRMVRGDLADLGIELLETEALPDVGASAALENLEVIPLAAELESSGDLGDEDRYRLENIARDYRSWGRGAYMASLSLADAPLNASQDNAEAFRGFLQRTYPNLAVLNGVWGTSFANWDALTMDDLRRDAPISLVDYRRFEIEALARQASETHAALAKVDPRATLGLRVSADDQQRLGAGWRNVMKHADFAVVPNERLMVERARSVASTGSALEVSMAAVSVAEARWLPWYAALHQIGGIWLSSQEAQSQDWLKSLAGEVTIVESGFAQVLRSSKRNNSRIAIYDSAQTGYLDEAMPVEGHDSAESAHAFIELLEDLGYQYDLVGYEEVVSGALSEYAVCILPMVRALADEESAALRAFALEGGGLLADVLPGRYDEHGAPRERSPLDELFGVEHEGALLLNFPIGSSENSGDLRNRLSMWLDAHGARRVSDYIAVQADGFDGEVVGFRFAGVRIAGLLSSPTAERKLQTVVLNAPEDGYSYDSLTGAFYGPGKRISLKLEPGEARLVTTLPYEVRRIALEIPKLIEQGRRLPISVTIKTHGKLPDAHVVHVSIENPEGKTLAHYSRTLDCPDGVCETYIPLALNERPGKYTVVVRDVFSGISGSAMVEVV